MATAVVVCRMFVSYDLFLELVIFGTYFIMHSRLEKRLLTSATETQTSQV